MLFEKFKVYEKNTIKNELMEDVIDYSFLKETKLFITKIDNTERIKEGVLTKIILFNALTLDKELKKGMLVEIDNIKYEIKDITKFPTKIFMELREE